MNPAHLSGFVKRVYPDFSMEKFNDRLKLQKLVYLVQAGGLNLGYAFRLYLHGPYCSLLAREGFDMPNLDECKIVHFENELNEKRFQEILNFLDNCKNDADKMEILASLHFFKKIYCCNSDEKLINLVGKKDFKFNGKTKLIRALLDKLKEINII